MTIYGYEIIGAWENSTCGKIAFAIKDGRRYVLKKYLSPVAPIDNGILDSKTIGHNQKIFDEFVAMRQTINNILCSCASLLVPCDQFIEGNCYVEVSESVENAISVHDIYNNLSEQEKMFLMKMLAGALITLHNKKIVHADISLQNVIIYRDHTGMYICKLIGFDSCFFVNNVPNEISGTVDFYSPEIGKYINAEDNCDELKKDISEKTDIFSLGLLYHFYLTGTLPGAVSLTDKLQMRRDSGKIIYPWVVLNSGCDIEISDRITSEQLRSLISDMVSVDANQRPSAAEVLERLRIVETPIGKPIMMTPTGFATPWEEHNIEFDIDKLKSRGFVSIENETRSGIKGYKLNRADAQSTFFKVDMLIAMKYAKKKATTEPVVAVEDSVSGFADPWPEHKIEFDVEAIIAKGYIASVQKTTCGINGYEFIHANGKRQFIRVEMLIIMKMAKKLK